MNPFRIFLNTLFYKTAETSHPEKNHTLYSIQINALNGTPIQLSDYKGKQLLFVNVASKCGFTPQYKALQELSDTYKDTLVVIGVPCNQFGKQEPGEAQDIARFCEVNYGVTFLITEKIDVKGNQAHPLYQWLTQKSKNGVSNTKVKWNFQKYLVNDKGALVDYFYSTTPPLSKKITKYL